MPLPDARSVDVESEEAVLGRPAEENIEAFAQRMRPRSLRMQLRFLKTLIFAFWLFGRAVFWQVFVFSYFPGWVSRGNTKRWKKYAREFRGFAVEMGGVMIKAGQFASTRADILPEEVIAELASLQDEVPTIDYRRIRDVMVRELGELSERYQSIDPNPIAAASLGQVHRATLLDGTPAVIKVQRPGIRGLIYTDLAALFIVARVAMRFRFINRRADLVDLSEEFGRVLLEEVSYRKEADNAARFGEMFADDPGVHVPKVYREHSTDFILTLEDVTTIKINDHAAMQAAGINPKEVAKRLMDTYMQQIFVDRFFHADPHPGNLFVRPLPVDDDSVYVTNGGGRPFQLIFIDFGMTGTLTREIVEGLIDTLTALITRDSAKLVRSYQTLGFLLPSADLQRIEEATTLVFDQVWGMSMTEITNIDFDVLSNLGKDFSELLYDMPFRVPQDFVYLGRTVGILTGMCTALDSEYNPWTEISYYMRELITGDENKNLVDELWQALAGPFLQLFANGPEGFIIQARDLIVQTIDRFRAAERTEVLLRQIVNGEVAITSKPNPQFRRQLDRIELQGRRTTRAFIFGSLLITSTMFYTNGSMELATVGYAFTGVTLISLLFMRA